MLVLFTPSYMFLIVSTIYKQDCEAQQAQRMKRPAVGNLALLTCTQLQQRKINYLEGEGGLRMKQQPYLDCHWGRVLLGVAWTAPERLLAEQM